MYNFIADIKYKNTSQFAGKNLNHVMFIYIFLCNSIQSNNGCLDNYFNWLDTVYTFSVEAILIQEEYVLK